ncbi:SIR2 family protein [Chryseobacterium sp. Bi04]|uniref:SIR2 family protein n=1 Tax=Chryseobacterium sp. Bi04 TaxID=2822345 RepID=UPI0033B46A31
MLTTNFEDLLEQVITKNSLPYSIIKEDKDLPYSNNTKLLVKIHGDSETGNFVFKEEKTGKFTTTAKQFV